MSDSNESVEIVDDAADTTWDGFEEAVPEPSFHPILEVWREVLKPAVSEQHAPVTPQWANKIVQNYAGITFADMSRYRELYFGKILELARIVDVEIESDEKCLGYASPEDDAVLNAHHYKNILLLWQSQFLQWELDWDHTHPDAAIEIAAISEAHKMFLGNQGITNFLDSIPFEFTESDQQLLADALTEQKEGRGE